MNRARSRPAQQGNRMYVRKMRKTPTLTLPGVPGEGSERDCGYMRLPGVTSIALAPGARVIPPSSPAQPPNRANCRSPASHVPPSLTDPAHRGSHCGTGRVNNAPAPGRARARCPFVCGCCTSDRSVTHPSTNDSSVSPRQSASPCRRIDSIPQAGCAATPRTCASIREAFDGLDLRPPPRCTGTTENAQRAYSSRRSSTNPTTSTPTTADQRAR